MSVFICIFDTHALTEQSIHKNLKNLALIVYVLF